MLDEVNEDDFLIVPNPTNGNYSIIFGDKLIGANVRVLNGLGQIVDQYNLSSSHKEDRILTVSTGVYIVEVRFYNGLVTKKLVVRY